MSEDYPYMVSNNKIKPILDAILNAAKPSKFSYEFLKKLGFSSSNDRAVISLFRRLGFLNESGAPTEFYDDLKDKGRRDFAIGERIKSLYSDIYSLNLDIHNASEDDVKGAMSRVTGKDAKSVARYYATFKTLVGLAKFDGKPRQIRADTIPEAEKESETNGTEKHKIQVHHSRSSPEFHYNIQIHLPATTEISVYNAIFKSLKETLMN